VDIVGCYVQITNRVTQVSHFVENFQLILALIRKLHEEQIQIRYIDIGGETGITFEDTTLSSPQEIIQAMSPIIRGMNLKIISEVGELIVGSAGLLIMKMEQVKKHENDKLIISIQENRSNQPTFHEDNYELLPIHEEKRKITGESIEDGVYDSGGSAIPYQQAAALHSSELVALRGKGISDFSVLTNFNLQYRIPEVRVQGDQFSLI
jgi:diaminopimelate decarboxylase